jgi:SAM-dependent methyltransferase
MKLADIANQTRPPLPWGEGDKIPWHEPEFSERMLQEHLNQNHDAASRRLPKVEEHVSWIHHKLLHEHPTKILDLGCGPGLYTSRLSKLGHDCVGIDYSPASIAYARNQATKEKLSCEYLLDDVRTAAYGTDFGLVMMIFGEFNTFCSTDARTILSKAYQALAENGILLLEPHTFDGVRGTGKPRISTWRTLEKGLFLSKPQLYLEEKFWDADQRISTTRYFIIDTSTGEVLKSAESARSYTNEEYYAILTETGFEDIHFYPSLTGEVYESHEGLLVVTARKR